MLKIIITIAIIIFIIAIFKNEIEYIASLIKVTYLNQKGVKDIQKKGINKRNLSNENIKKYIDYSYKALDSKNVKYGKKFILDKSLENKLLDSKFQEKFVRELLDNILDYLSLDKSLINLKINYLSSRQGMAYAGYYQELKEIENKNIVINIRNDMNIYNVVSILVHESTHYLLFTNKIFLKDTMQNECLTDITTLVMGFGKYMYEGYKISNRVFNDGEQMVYINKDRVGYLTSKDIKYALKYIK